MISSIRKEVLFVLFVLPRIISGLAGFALMFDSECCSVSSIKFKFTNSFKECFLLFHDISIQCHWSTDKLQLTFHNNSFVLFLVTVALARSNMLPLLPGLTVTRPAPNLKTSLEPVISAAFKYLEKFNSLH